MKDTMNLMKSLKLAVALLMDTAGFRLITILCMLRMTMMFYALGGLAGSTLLS